MTRRYQRHNEHAFLKTFTFTEFTPIQGRSYNIAILDDFIPASEVNSVGINYSNLGGV